MKIRSPRELPSLGKLLEADSYQHLLELHGEHLFKCAARETLEEYRRRLLSGEEVTLEDLPEELEERLEPSQRRVLNVTGTILHTNLGRAPLGGLLTTVAERLKGYSVLEFSLETGKRGSRGAAVERLLRWMTGSEAAVVVNNCSAAMILLLTVHAKGKEVIVSRGELVEIGGGFRIPDILALSGARLVEVGTTNRTRIADYERAVNENTGMFLTTHASNFKIEGFTEAPAPEQLISLGARHDLPVVFDLGSGMLTPVVEEEPSVTEASRFSLTAFSGDKLLGGPQCGVIMGKKELVEQCKRHPFYRAFRCDKLTLALLEETLRNHASSPESVPTVRLLSTPVEELRKRALIFLDGLSDVLPEGVKVEVVDSVARVGGGSLPGGEVTSVACRFTDLDAQELQRAFRTLSTPVIVRVHKEAVYIDFRSIPPEDDAELLELTREVFS